MRIIVDETHVVIRKEYLDDVNEILQEEVSAALRSVRDGRRNAC